MNGANQLLNLHGLAVRLRRYGLSVDWLKSEADAGRLPCLRVGRRLLFNAEAVEKALAERAATEARPRTASATT